jgi:hypothetical protein
MLAKSNKHYFVIIIFFFIVIYFYFKIFLKRNIKLKVLGFELILLPPLFQWLVWNTKDLVKREVTIDECTDFKNFQIIWTQEKRKITTGTWQQDK